MCRKTEPGRRVSCRLIPQASSIRPRAWRTGFTILEVLVALGILTVGSTCVVALYSAALETFRRSQVEVLATHLAVEVLDSSEDLLAHGAPVETLPALLKKRIAVPPRFFYDVTCKADDVGGVSLNVRVSSDGRGRTRRWEWRRVVLIGTGNKILPISREPPWRYKYRRRGVTTGR